MLKKRSTRGVGRGYRGRSCRYYLTLVGALEEATGCSYVAEVGNGFRAASRPIVSDTATGSLGSCQWMSSCCRVCARVVGPSF